MKVPSPKNMEVSTRSNIRERALRRALPATLAVVAGALFLLPAQASGHAVVRPGSSRPADLQVYTLTVPNERDAATDEVALQVPAQIDFLLVDNAPGWKVELERRGGRTAVVRWRSGTIEPDFYETLRFIARNPVRQGVLEWNLNQHYVDGDTVRWIGAPDSDKPASRTRLSETAEPQDVVSVHGERESSATPTSTPTTAAKEVDERDELALAIAIVAAAAALVSLLFAVRARRR